MEPIVDFCWKFFYRPDEITVNSQQCQSNKDISLTVRERLYSSCVRSSMLHGSETWPVRKENEVALQQAEMRMVSENGVKLKYRVLSKELRERLRLDNILLVLQQNRL